MDFERQLHLENARAVTRRQFLKHSQTGLGAIALAMLAGRDGSAADRSTGSGRNLTAPPTTR